MHVFHRVFVLILIKQEELLVSFLRFQHTFQRIKKEDIFENMLMSFLSNPTHSAALQSSRWTVLHPDNAAHVKWA